MTKSQNEIELYDDETVGKLLQRLHYQYMTKRVRSLAILSEKKSTGKTTAALMLCRGLTEIYGLKVLYVDLNPLGDGLLNQHLKDYLVKDYFALTDQFAFSVFRVKDLDIDWTINVFEGPYLNRMISQFSSKFDFVIVDTFNTNNDSSPYLKVNTDSHLILVKNTNEEKMEEDSQLSQELLEGRKKIFGILNSNLREE